MFKYRSNGERLIAQMLLENRVAFIHDCELSWSLNKRYDFYLVDHRVLVEIAGDQHRMDSTFGTKAVDVQKIDELKNQLATDHNFIYVSLIYTQSDLALLKQEFEAKLLPLLVK